MYHLEANKQISAQQHGFRENHSCETALQELLKVVRQNRTSGQITSAIAVDITGAFDAVNWNTTIQELIKYRCPSQITNMIASYLENRTITIKWGDHSSQHTLSRGCPQGSCIGPALWLVTAEKIIKAYTSINTKLIVFADDFLLVTSDKHRREIESNSQMALQSLSEQIANNGLTVSEAKTSVITFPVKGKALKKEPSIKLNGKKLPNARSLKYLGLTITRNLTWHAHFDALRLKVQTHQQNLAKVAGRLWGVPSNLLKIWYKTVTESSILYASGIWGMHLTAAEKGRLLKLQRPSLLRIARAYRTTPTSAL